MKIIVSPAKKMNINTDLLDVRQRPVFLEHSEQLLQYLRLMNFEELKTLWKCNDKLTALNLERIQSMNLNNAQTPALLSYEGLQYQHLAPAVLENSHWEYIENHLRILSGFYGILRPLDGITPYRLEMQAALATEQGKNLYQFWGRKIYDELTKETDTIINLASKEYSRAVEPYLAPDITYITCVFGEEKDGKIIEKGTYAKMARGEMVRFMAEKNISSPQQMKEFCSLGFRYHAAASDDKNFIFIREK